MRHEDDDFNIRLTALDRASMVNLQLDYDTDGNSITNVDKLLKATKEIEAYLKGTNNG